MNTRAFAGGWQPRTVKHPEEIEARKTTAERFEASLADFWAAQSRRMPEFEEETGVGRVPRPLHVPQHPKNAPRGANGQKRK
jgi:hypothetical protein